MRITILIAGMMLMLSGCAYLQTITDSKEFKAFCGWAPVAVSAVEAATVESAKDPSKKIATEAMGNAVLFLRLASAQCPVVTTP